MSTPAYIAQALEQGKTIDELATELEVTARHARRLAKAAGWVPGPRRYAGPRVLKVRVAPEVYAAIEARGGRSVEDTIEALLAIVADAQACQATRENALKGDSHAWAAGYLDAFVARIGGAR